MISPHLDPKIISYSKLLFDSFQHWTKTRLLEQPFADDAALSEQLYFAPFVLVSHGTEADPIFRYANRKAQAFWKMDWQTFTQMPSRLSAKPDAQEERQRLLETAARQGYVDDYSGIRIASDGQTFYIRKTLLWNVVDANGVRHGQAAVFNHWDPIA